MVFPAVSSLLMDNFGVDGMVRVLAVFVLVVGIAAIFWAQNYPEDVGRAPDNQKMTAEEISASKETMLEYVSPWTVKHFLREKRTWLIGVGLGLL